MISTYQGVPCARAGHTERYVSTGACVVCMKADAKKWNAENTEKKKAYDKKYFDEHPGLKAYYQALRHKRIKIQTPLCVSMDAIKAFYLATPKGYEVDHIYPISKGGFHMLSNFQYLTAHENRMKGSQIL